MISLIRSSSELQSISVSSVVRATGANTKWRLQSRLTRRRSDVRDELGILTAAVMNHSVTGSSTDAHASDVCAELP